VAGLEAARDWQLLHSTPSSTNPSPLHSHARTHTHARTQLHKLLQEYPDVILVKVNFEANRAMCKSLGIKVLPFFHFYHGAEGRVAAFSATVSKLQRLKDALELHSGAICSLEPPVGLTEFPDVHAAHPDDATLLNRDGWQAGLVAEAAAASP